MDEGNLVNFEGQSARADLKARRSGRPIYAVLLLVAGGFAATVGAETSQVYSRNVELLPRPGYDAEGVPAGSFRAFPSVTLEGRYDDNIFSTDTGEESDFIFSLRPELVFSSDWNVHSLEFAAGGDFVGYSDNDDENHQNFFVRTNGLYEVQRDLSFRGGVGYARSHEGRGSANDAGGTEPTQVDTLSPSVGLFYQDGLFSFDASASARVLNLEDVSTTTASINNDDRDRTEYDIGLRAAYEYTRYSELYLRGRYLPREYRSSVDDNGFNRDSDGYELVIGADVELSGVTAAGAFIGYRNQDYDDARLGEVDGLQYGANFTWNVLRTTSIDGSITRSVEETTINNASGFFVTSARVGIDHEVMRNFLVGADASFSRNDYEGTSREDDDVRVNLYGNYMFNRNFHLRAGYDFTDHDSNVAGSDYQKNVVNLQLRGQF
jgi:hypothetical protein